MHLDRILYNIGIMNALYIIRINTCSLITSLYGRHWRGHPSESSASALVRVERIDRRVTTEINLYIYVSAYCIL